MVDCPIELLQCLFRSAKHCVIDPQPVGSKHAAWIHLLVQNKYGGLPPQVSRYIGTTKPRRPGSLFLCEPPAILLEGRCKIFCRSLIGAVAQTGTDQDRAMQA